MLKFSSWHDEEELSTLPDQDALGILSSTRTVVQPFRDIVTYHTHPVKFLKRAQICIADLYNAFG